MNVELIPNGYNKFLENDSPLFLSNLLANLFSYSNNQNYYHNLGQLNTKWYFDK